MRGVYIPSNDAHEVGYCSGFQTGVRGPKGARDGCPGGPREDSGFTNMKTKYRSRLVVENDMRVCLSNITPRIDSLCKAKHTNIACLPL